MDNSLGNLHISPAGAMETHATRLLVHSFYANLTFVPVQV